MVRECLCERRRSLPCHHGLSPIPMLAPGSLGARRDEAARRRGDKALNFPVEANGETRAMRKTGPARVASLTRRGTKPAAPKLRKRAAETAADVLNAQLAVRSARSLVIH